MQISDFKREVIINVFDEYLLLFGRYRIPGEDNLDVRELVMNLGEFLANSSYQGLVNGISVDLFIDPYRVYNKYWYPLDATPLTSGDYYLLTKSYENWKEPRLYINEVLQDPMAVLNESGEFYEGWLILPSYSGKYLPVMYIKDQLNEGDQLRLEYYAVQFDGIDLYASWHKDEAYEVDLNGNVMRYGERLTYRAASSGDVEIFSFADEDFLRDYGFIDFEGRPTNLYKQFIAEFNKSSPVYYKDLTWGKDYFDMHWKDGIGQRTLGSIWDAGDLKYLLNLDCIYGVGKYGRDLYASEIACQINSVTVELTLDGSYRITVDDDFDFLYLTWLCQDSGYFSIEGLARSYPTQVKTTTKYVDYINLINTGEISIISVHAGGEKAEPFTFNISDYY